MEHKICENCGKQYVKTLPKAVYPSTIAQYEERWRIRKFCTTACARKSAVRESWKNPEARQKRLDGIQKFYTTPEGEAHRKKLTESQQGKNADWWKDNDASYNSKHRWIQKHWKRTGVCQQCKIAPAPRKNGHSGTEWANISGKYDRNDRKDWLELCPKCHKFFDKVKRIARSQ